MLPSSLDPSEMAIHICTPTIDIFFFRHIVDCLAKYQYLTRNDYEIQMQNYFKLFELEEKYSIDTAELNSKYFSLLAKYHPDKAFSSEEKYKFFTLSSVINNGYKILLDDFERAAHILELHGINIKNDSQAPKLPLNILEEILDMKERFDFADSQEEKQQMTDLYTEKRKAILAVLPSLFDAKDYQAAAIKTMMLKYYK